MPPNTPVPVLPRALFIISALLLVASLLGTAAVVHQHSLETFGAVNGLPDPALDPRPANLLAVNVHFGGYTEAALNHALDQLEGFGWLRQEFGVDLLGPSKTSPWPEWDRLVSVTTKRQKKIIAVLMADWSITPAQFAKYAQEFAARYTDQIDVYQIGDEPNLISSWGRPPSAAEYAALLQAAYTAIHAADPTATVIAAALAPTVETGPENVSDLIYLQQLYDLGAGKYFDAAAGKPYGFYTGPDDRLADPAILNFSRFTRLRQVMEKNGDAHKLLWGGNFGWNVLDNTPWGKTTPEQQKQFTLNAYQRAMSEWPWAGPLALEAYQPAAPPDDPHWGFALADPNGQLTPLGQAISTFQSPITTAVPGNYLALHPAARYTGDWEFSELGADIPENFANAHIEISFQGTDLALAVRRGDYRGYLYVTIDGQPANLLPRDDRGAYLVLTSPALEPQVITIPVASGLAPDQTHIAAIQPERGWDQWAFVGFSVGRQLPFTNYRIALGFLIIIAFLSVTGMWHFGRGLAWGAAGARVRAAWERLGATGQLIVTALVGGVLYLSSWLTFGDDVIAVSRRFGDTLPIVVTALTAGLFYFAPSFLVALAAILALLVLFYLRLDLALAFIALFIPFYLFPRMLWSRGASVLEFSLWLTFLAWLLRNFRPLLAQDRIRKTQDTLRPLLSAIRHRLSSLDFAVIAFVFISLASVLAAERKDVAAYEFRTVILDSALYYSLLRAIPLDRRALWRIVDFFLLGAVLIALIGLYQTLTGTGLITAEEGVARIRSVYGSPNNLALYLGRALPIAVVVALMGGRATLLRRSVYALAALLLGLTIFLTFSKGALLLGVPAALALILIFWLGRRGLILVGAGAAAAVASLPLLNRLPRFAGFLNPEGGTSFFRVKVWLSAWRMFVEHPLLGVGPDNFLYQYRSKYILPEAWQDPNLSHPHNIALDYLSRVGLFGFVCALWLHLGFWRTALDAYRRLRSSLPNDELIPLCVGLMASVADMLAHGLVDNSFFLVDLAFVFCLTLGIVQHLRKFAL